MRNIGQDTILWREESDAYTQRAMESYGGVGSLYSPNKEWSSLFKSTLEQYIEYPQYICDIGCGYGSAINELVDAYGEASIVGIDPGEKSIQIAKNNIISNRVTLKVGYSHSLSVEDNSVDVVILRMVLQWIPRGKLLQTVAEIDRVLKVNGVIWLEDFLPNRPITSVSHHNSAVFIFKENYPDYFLSCPWYREVFRQVKHIAEGEDQQRHISIIKKYSFEDVYIMKSSATEKNST